MAGGGDGARQQRGRNFLTAFAAHFFNDPGNEAISDGLRRFGRVVARTEPRAAGCQDDIDAIRIREFAELLADIGGIVGDAQVADYSPSGFAAKRHDRRAGKIFAFTAGDGVADGEDRDAHRDLHLGTHR